MTSPSGVGEQELALLEWVAEHGPVSVGEAARQYGDERGLARTTVQTMLERLRQKGHLRRSRRSGVYRYSSPHGPMKVLQRAVDSFVDGALRGAVTPLVAYLAEREEVSDEERRELERIVARLESEEEAADE